jgi:hypothetical protein
VGTPAGYFGFGARGVGQHLVFDKRGGKRVDELKISQILQHRPTPLRQRGRQVTAGTLEIASGGGLYACRLLNDESAYVAVDVGNGKPIPRHPQRAQHTEPETPACHRALL